VTEVDVENDKQAVRSDAAHGLMRLLRELRLFLAVLVLPVWIVAAQDAVSKPVGAQEASSRASVSAQELIVPAGTTLQLASDQEFNSKKLHAGDELRFSVSRPVVFHNRVLAQTGATVTAKVIEVTKPGSGLTAGGVILDLSSLRLLDGSDLRLMAVSLTGPDPDPIRSPGGAAKAVAKVMFFSVFAKGETVHLHKGDKVYADVQDSITLDPSHFSPPTGGAAVAEIIISHFTYRYPTGYGDVYCGTVRIHKTGIQDAFKVQLKPGTYWFSGEYGPPLQLILEAGQREYLALRSVGVDQDPRHFFHIETAQSRHSFLIQSSEAEYENSHTSAPIKKVISLVDADPVQLTAKPIDRARP
jgi:hypothetical protein